MKADRFTVQRDVLQLALAQAIQEILYLQSLIIRFHPSYSSSLLYQDMTPRQIEESLIEENRERVASGYCDLDKRDDQESLDSNSKVYDNMQKTYSEVLISAGDEWHE